VLEVLEENLLAGVVLTDALEYVTRLVWIMNDGQGEIFPDTQAKRRLTEAAREYAIDFEVPQGWEFVVGPRTHPAGFSGIAVVRRCHLSQNIYQGEHGYGRLLGASKQGLEDAAGFDIPCDYFPELRVEGANLLHGQMRNSFGVGQFVPFAFVRRAFRLPWGEGKSVTFIPRPADDELVSIARAAVEHLTIRAATDLPPSRRQGEMPAVQEDSP
jgi:hypothetical protein